MTAPFSLLLPVAVISFSAILLYGSFDFGNLSDISIQALNTKYGPDALNGLPISPTGLNQFDIFMRACMADKTPQDVCAQKWQAAQQ